MRNTNRASLLAVALALGFVFVPNVGQSAPARPALRDILRAGAAVHDFDAVELSPDGRRVAWSETFRDGADPLTSPRQTAVYVRALASGSAIRISAATQAGAYDEENPVWSPDGKQIAFLSDARSPHQTQIFVASADGSNVRQIGQLNGEAQGLSWSPRGDRLGLLYISHATRKAGATNAGAREVGDIGAKTDEQRLTTVDVVSGSVRVLTPPNVYVYEYGWSPDGRQCVATYALGNGDDNWWIAKLSRIDARTGAMHQLLAPNYQIADPQWSPDGKHIAFIGGLMSDFTITGGDVYLVDAATGATRNATAGQPISFESLRWTDATHLDAVAYIPGAMHLVRLETSTGSLQTLTARAESVWNWSSALHGGVVALVRESFSEPAELWAGPPSSLRQISHINARAPRYVGKTVSIRWKSDSAEAQGWLIYPRGYDPRRRYPMVTLIHGGPAWEWVPLFSGTTISALSSSGYVIFLPNPRGSYGQGEAFTRGNVKDFGYGDWRDDLRGVDAAIRTASIDPHRLGLTGWSYGGYMAMWAETQTTRFKALVAGAGIFNYQSYYGENQIDRWMIPFFGSSVYEDPSIYAKSSPITFVLHSKTPILVLAGELDEETPAAQALECWHAMRTLGVPVKLVVYAGEGHHPRKVANQIDIVRQTIAWFDHYLR
ncbi:MAG TPA: S9 family peptidase [Candidatus Baltobacteraceae bacterium]|jgi:dipeptidyl aminopeptidase/acylaminoacyl peptidase